MQCAILYIGLLLYKKKWIIFDAKIVLILSVCVCVSCNQNFIIIIIVLLFLYIIINHSCVCVCMYVLCETHQIQTEIKQEKNCLVTIGKMIFVVVFFSNHRMILKYNILLKIYSLCMTFYHIKSSVKKNTVLFFNFLFWKIFTICYIIISGENSVLKKNKQTNTTYLPVNN